MKPLVLTITVSTLVLGALAWVVPEDLFVRHKARFEHDPTRDPKPGLSIAKLTLPHKDVLGREIPTEQKRDFVIAAGSCTGCSLDAIKFELLPTAEFTRVFVVYQSDDKSILENIGKRAIPDNVYVIADLDDRKRDTLNATWIGRWYVFEDGTLRLMQSDLKDKNWSG